MNPIRLDLPQTLPGLDREGGVHETVLDPSNP